MKRIIVTFSDIQNFSYDLELPDGTALKDLYPEIIGTINALNQANHLYCSLQGRNVMYSKRNDRYLKPDESFQKANVYSGDTIIIQSK